MRNSLGLLAFLSGSLLTACDDAAPTATAAEPVVRDSAGITIVENSAPQWGDGEGWSLSDDPALEIGMMDGPEEYQLDRVMGAARLPDGRIVIANRGSSQLRLYGPEGGHLADFGREGDGPGEFRGMSRLLAWDDGFVAGLHGLGKRVEVFAPDGGHLRSVSLDAGSMVNRSVNVFEDGAFLVAPGGDPHAMREREAGRGRAPVTYLRYAADGRSSDTVAVVSGTEEVVFREGGFESSEVIFGRNHFVAVQGERFHLGDNEIYEIRSHDPAGTLRRIVRKDHAHEPVPAAEVERRREALIERFATSAPANVPREFMESVTERYRRAPARETLPAFAGLRVDRAENLWVRHATLSEDTPARYDVFDAAGRFLGPVDIPEGLRLHDIGEDFLLGVHRDDFDVEYVRMYELIKPEAAS